MKNNFIIRIISLILILNVIINFIGTPKTTADSYRYIYDGGNLNTAKYKNYKDKLDAIKKEHPSWKIMIMETKLDWDTVIKNQAYILGNSSPRSLIESKSGEWVNGNTTYDNGSWKAASEKAIAYVMDPRNFLVPDSSYLMQFLQLSYKETSDENVKNGLVDTFLDSMENARILNSASREANINPYYVIARIIQEQGRKGSSTYKMESDGKTYYNIFNIGANGNGISTILQNALNKAKEKGWDSLEKCLRDGVKFLSFGYINQKQDSLYLNKFDVESYGGLYSHQYQQNIEAPKSEGSLLYNRLKNANLLDQEMVFIIPVYENMPEYPSPIPDSTSETIPVNIRLKPGRTDFNIRSEPNINSRVVGIVPNSNTIVLSARRNTSGWHRVILENGTRGYVLFTSAWEQIPDIETNKDIVVLNQGNTMLRTGPGFEETGVIKLEKNLILTRVDSSGRYKFGRRNLG